VLLGVFNTGLAYVLYNRLIKDLGATTAAAVDYLVPVFAVIISVLLLGEPLTWNLLVGGVILLIGMAYGENRLPHRAPEATATERVLETVSPTGGPEAEACTR
jgi:drug/metabolite transporter (DMT)-like permease